MSWWRHVMAMELRKLLAYRSDFWVTFLGQTFLQLVIAKALWTSIFHSQNVEVLNGFTLESITLYALIVPLGNKILMGENIGFLSREIYDGTFTKYLLYPLSVFQYKAVTYFTYSLYYALQLVIWYSLYRLCFVEGFMSWTELGNLMLGMMLFILGASTYLMMAMMMELLALFADNVWSLMVMLRFFTSFFGGGMVPLTFFPEWSLKFLNLTPFPYLVSLPARTVLGKTTGPEILSGMGILIFWTLLFMGGVKLMWNRGQKSYAGVGI
jgi:ABC-2 type transport system permease protein